MTIPSSCVMSDGLVVEVHLDQAATTQAIYMIQGRAVPGVTVPAGQYDAKVTRNTDGELFVIPKHLRHTREGWPMANFMSLVGTMLPASIQPSDGKGF